MKLLILMVFLMVSGCSSHIYGVPEKAWQTLTSEQKTETIRGYNERQLLEQKARVHREEQRAAQARVDAELELDRARRQAEQVGAIYRNEAGQYGDLIRVSVSGGTMAIGGKPRIFQGMSFKIADGESKEITVWSDERKNPRQGVLLVSYLDGVLLVDDSPRRNRHAARIIYDPAWKSGRTYLQVHSSGPMQLQGVQVAIEIIPPRGH
ncbi:MAG: hypothetical protein ACYDAI_11695 [Trichloromonadaceae bacterium]